VDEIPVMFKHRQLSIRAYDGAAMMVGAKVVAGSDLEATIRHLFANENLGYLHIHNAGPGCFNCSVVRA
jgi:6-phosphogluconate dehydrogenase (decarboxylating)